MSKVPGIISIGGVVPYKRIDPSRIDKTMRFLEDETEIPSWLTDDMRRSGRWCGTRLSNEDGWLRQPWRDAWLAAIPSDSRRAQDPFHGLKSRCRFPLDQASVLTSSKPYPIESSTAAAMGASVALVNGGLTVQDIDFMICVTIPNDSPPPHADAQLVHRKLRMPSRIPVMQMMTICQSLPLACELASSLIRGGTYKKILLAFASVFSATVDLTDYTSVVMSDAAMGAVIGEVDPPYGFKASGGKTNSKYFEAITTPFVAPALQASFRWYDPFPGQYFTKFGGTTPEQMQLAHDMTKQSVEGLISLAEEVVAKAGLDPSQIKAVVPHNPFEWLIKAWQKRSAIPADRYHMTFKKYGNVAVCTILINILEAIENGVLKAGDHFCSFAPGGGESTHAFVECVSPQLVESVGSSPEWPEDDELWK